MNEKLTRRDFLRDGVLASALLALGVKANGALRIPGKKATSPKILILGFDGMDPRLVEAWIREGRLPAFAKLRSQGGFRPLGTSIPPQSPVAWSNFISGTNPGGHGIFDFIHRDPENYLPIFSASATEEASKTVRIGDMVLPIKGGRVRNLRKGRAFWQILEEHEIPATVFKIPSNYPPVETRQRTFSGMGTPDLLGYYGWFRYYTTEPKDLKEDIGGGEVIQVFSINGRIDAKLEGPVNTYRKDRPRAEIDLKVYTDPENGVAKIVLPDQEFILREKEWSGWKRVRFHLIPTQSVTGICMFYLKELRPNFKLYVSPINIDPADPALPIATPPSYANELARKFGPFFTKGLPADTSALDNDVLDEEEFLRQDGFVLEESREMLDDELSRFASGLLFFYISSTDQRQHMFWRLFDKASPMYEETLAAHYGSAIARIYQEADRILADAMAKIDRETVLLVMSDHGFNPFHRAFNLNTWLRLNGYHKFTNEFKQEDLELAFASTDWSKTRAYGLGLNGLYINQKGREANGIVRPGPDKDNLVREIARKLESATDPKTGDRVVLRAYVAKDVYSGPYVDEAPDIILGFNRGYRISFNSPLGRTPKDVLDNNTSKWSGDHMGAAELMPGIVLANRAIVADSPALSDITATILDVFGVEKPKEFIGKTIF
jgi:predicted AlkP superfamily phosphohydrolase/phosphomutase